MNFIKITKYVLITIFILLILGYVLDISIFGYLQSILKVWINDYKLIFKLYIIQPFYTFIFEIIPSVCNYILSTLISFFNWLFDKIPSVCNSIASDLMSVFNWLFDTIPFVCNSIVFRLIDMFYNIYEKLSDIRVAIKSAVDSKIDINNQRANCDFRNFKIMLKHQFGKMQKDGLINTREKYPEGIFSFEKFCKLPCDIGDKAITNSNNSPVVKKIFMSENIKEYIAKTCVDEL